MATITPLLASQIAAVIEARPEHYRKQPAHEVIVSDLNMTSQHLQDWAFTQGFTFVMESYKEKGGGGGFDGTASSVRIILAILVKYRRPIDSVQEPIFVVLDAQFTSRSVGRRQKETSGCFAMENSRTISINQVLIHSQLNHTTPIALDIFKLYRWLRLISGVVGFRTSSDILHKMGLEFDRKELYNLQHKREETKLTPQEEARLVITHLDGQGCHVHVDEIYVLDNVGNKTNRVSVVSFGIRLNSSRLNRRFALSFLLETDATFNKESRRLLLHNLIGFDNCGKMYPAIWM
jgi:hypothetical protein